MQAFFPIIKHEHYYVIVFNLKYPSVSIIDSEKDAPIEKDAMLKSYGYTPEILVRNIEDYENAKHTYSSNEQVE